MNWLLALIDQTLTEATRLVQSIPVRRESSLAPQRMTSSGAPPATPVLEEFRRSMIRLRTRNECEDEILRFTRELFETDHAGLLLWDEEKGMFVNRRSVPGARNAWNIYDPFFLSIAEHDRILKREDLPSIPEETDRRNIEEFIQDTGAHWVIPLILNEAVLAVLFVGGGRAAGGPDRAVLEDFRSYAVLSLSNSIIYTRVESLLLSLEDKVRERTRQLEEATNQMIQSEKMATLGVMVAGVAHELNTPSGVILNASRNLTENLESLLDRLLVSDWLRTPEQVARFAQIARFFGFHLLTGNLAVPRNAYQLRRRALASLEEAGVPYPADLAAFFTEHGFFEEPESAESARMRERLEGDHLIAMIVKLFGELEESGQKTFLGYLRDVAGIYRNAKNISVSGASIAHLVKALRIYSRSGPGDVVSANIVELIESTLDVLGSIWKNRVAVVRSLEKLPPVECNPDSLNQVWSNLLMNAYQAAREQERPELLVRTFSEPNGSHIVVKVRDNGTGIPEPIREKIWDPFFTTKEQGEGTGLGLAIVRRIVEDHGGEINFTTGSDGTEFTVRLPVVRKKETQSVSSSSSAPSASPPPGRYDWRG